MFACSTTQVHNKHHLVKNSLWECLQGATVHRLWSSIVENYLKSDVVMASTNSHLSAFFGSAEEREHFKEDDRELGGAKPSQGEMSSTAAEKEKQGFYTIMSVNHLERLAAESVEERERIWLVWRACSFARGLGTCQTRKTATCQGKGTLVLSEKSHLNSTLCN